jgi:hypothetical protein
MILVLMAVQAAVAQPPATQQPDLQLGIDVTARRVVVDNRGDLDLTARAAVNGRQSDGNVVEVDAPEVPQGRRELNNVRVRVRAETRIADPLADALDRSIPQEPQSPR